MCMHLFGMIHGKNDVTAGLFTVQEKKTREPAYSLGLETVKETAEKRPSTSFFYSLLFFLLELAISV